MTRRWFRYRHAALPYLRTTDALGNVTRSFTLAWVGGVKFTNKRRDYTDGLWVLAWRDGESVYIYTQTTGGCSVSAKVKDGGWIGKDTVLTDRDVYAVGSHFRVTTPLKSDDPGHDCPVDKREAFRTLGLF